MHYLVLLGAGGQARETYWHLKDIFQEKLPSLIFVDDITTERELLLDGTLWPVVNDWDFSRYQSKNSALEFVVALGAPQAKQMMVERALAAGLTPAATIVHPSAIVQDPHCELGRGGIIAPRCVLTTGVSLADYVLLNVGVTIGHDCRIGTFVSCAPQVALAGGVQVGERSSIGIAAVVREKVTIAPGVVVAAQACVVDDVLQAETLVLGVPARSRANS